MKPDVYDKWGYKSHAGQIKKLKAELAMSQRWAAMWKAGAKFHFSYYDNAKRKRLTKCQRERDGLAELLREWQGTPFFETDKEWLEWVSKFGPRVEAALASVQQGGSEDDNDMPNM